MKILHRFFLLRPALLYGLFNAFVGLIVGFYVYIKAIGDGYGIFMLSAPLAMFGIGSLVWRITMKNEEIKPERIVFLGVLTGTITHYFTWVFTSVFLNLCYWCTGGCTDSFGNSPESIVFMFRYGFVYSFFSLLFYGWVTVLGSILCGMIMWWFRKL